MHRLNFVCVENRHLDFYGIDGIELAIVYFYDIHLAFKFVSIELAFGIRK